VERGQKPFVIGIAGPSGSGKTELAGRLVDALAGHGALRVPLDCYYRDLAGLEPELRDQLNFDHPDALDLKLLVPQLAALAGGQGIEMPVYRFDTHTRAPEGRRVVPGGVVVVDGLHCLYWPEVRGLLHAKLFVDADHATCLARRIERDVRERGRTEASVRAQYELTVRPMYEKYVRPTRSHADVVLRGEASLDAGTAAVLAYVRRVWPGGGGIEPAKGT
jgi:uridine kinase